MTVRAHLTTLAAHVARNGDGTAWACYCETCDRLVVGRAGDLPAACECGVALTPLPALALVEALTTTEARA